MDELELTIQELKQETTSTPDYRQTVEKLQVANDLILLVK